MESDKYKQAQKEFKNKMIELRKKQSVVLARISKKLDQQKIDKLLKKLK